MNLEIASAVPLSAPPVQRVTRLRRWLYIGYAIALAIGGAMIGVAYQYGSQLVDQTVSLVRHDMPTLQRLQAARTAVQEYQTVLFEYYATGDRRRYAELAAVCDARLRDLLQNLDLPDEPGGFAETLNHGHAELFALGDQLDRLMSTSVAKGAPDAERARYLLSGATYLATRLHDRIEQEIVPLQARAESRSIESQQVLNILVRNMLLLGGAILLMSMSIGYFANAYIRERVERQRLATFPERNPNPVLSLDCDGQLHYANEGAQRWLQENGFAHNAYQDLLPADRTSRLKDLLQTPRGYTHWEYELTTQAGIRFMSCGIHYLEDFCEFHLFISDITERKEAERQLRHQAMHDALTGLPNRRSFEQQLDALTIAENPNPFSLLFISVDRFSAVVQGLGHAQADQVLKTLAARLEEVFADRAIDQKAYRFDGTMFAVLLPATAPEIRDLALREIDDLLTQPLQHHGREYFFSFTLGSTAYPGDGDDTAALLRNADSALQAAARHGTGAHAWYLPAMNDRATHRFELESKLRHAVERNELVLHYQPQLDLASGRMIGAEALLRWVPHGQAMISPADFIPIAEESGLIVPIGEWVMREACLRNQAWRAAGYDGLLVAVNVSAQQFVRPGFPATVRRVLTETRLPPHLLELEVTESVAMDDVESTIATLAELRSIGIHLSIDDFGTGYSSLSYLKRFPIDKLKVDQSFVRHMTQEADAAAIARAVIDLGHSLRLKVIAEGVETINQLDLLRQYGCHEMQGYYYSRPVTPDAFAALLAEGRLLPARQAEGVALVSS